MTLEELLKLMKEQPTLYKGLLANAINTEEGKELLENYAKQHSDKLLTDKEKEVKEAYEKTVFDSLGIAKPEGKTTEEYLKELAAEVKGLKENKGGDGDEAKKIVELEKTIDAFKTANWEGKYNTLASETANKIEGYTKEIEKLTTGNMATLVSNDLTLGLSNVKFNPNIPKDVVDTMVESVKNKVLKTAKNVDGKVVYYKEDGSPYLNDVFKPVNAEEIFQTELKSIIQSTANKGGGADSGKSGIVKVAADGKESKKVSLDSSKFSTKLEFANHIEEVLLENGVERNSKEWHDLTQEARVEYNVDKLERQ